MKILIKGKVETVSLDRVKPAHFECEPATGTATQCKTQSKMTNSKTTEIVRGSRKDQNRSSSTLTQKSDRTRVQSKTNTQTQSAAAKIGKNLATQHQAHRVNLPKQFTPYVAPHSRASDVFHANGSDKIISDDNMKQTRVGRKIHTPARFVQMVHAIVAPNDLYGGTSYTYRNNYNL